MTFTPSPADVATIVKFCRAIYRKCKDASGEYLEISREVRGLHTVLRLLKYEVEAPDSILNRDKSIYGRELAPVMADCDFTLRMLDGLIQKYGRQGDGSSSNPRMFCDKVKFGSNEMDQLGDIRVKLISHKTCLTLFLDTMQINQAGKVSSTLDIRGEQLDMILDKVDGIASRMCQSNGGIMANYDDDEKEVWKQFRRELVADGFDSAVLQQHKDVLQAYIREIDQQGLLDEVVPNPRILSTSAVSPERWLDSAQSECSEANPLSVRSLESSNTDDSIKEMVAREDNMKFPQSIKAQRALLDSKREDQQMLEIPEKGIISKPLGGSSGTERQPSGVPTQRRSSPVPGSVTSTETDQVFHHASDSESEEPPSSVVSKRGSEFTELALVIRTSDLTSEKSNFAVASMPAGSPSSFRSYGSFGSEDIPRTMAYRFKEQSDYGSSPTSTGAFLIPRSNVPGKDGQTNPRPEPMRLAPDQNGNEIPADARWTQIKRSLVSPEVLEQDRRRYEARPDFVAVLGLLSLEEIRDYTVRSQELREARRRNRRQRPPPQPPRPVPIAIPIAPSGRKGRDNPSDEYSSSSEDENHQHPRRYSRQRPRPSSPTGSYTHINHSGYPHPYGIEPPSPTLSSTSTLTPQTVRNPQTSPRDGRMYSSSSNREREKEKDRQRDREKERSEVPRRHSSPLRDSKHVRTHSFHAKGENKEKPKSRWKENMGAGAVGGAAMSLLHVLAEAAEGL